MADPIRTLGRIFSSLVRVLLHLLTFRFLVELVEWIRHVCELRRKGKALRDVRRGRPLRCSPRCATVRPDVYKRADPLIYSQLYLMEQGLAVTWDNPDIQLFDGAVPVSSSELQAGRTYQVVATIYNNSTEAPAVGLPVAFSFRSFGVGAAITQLGTAVVDLPVKGSPDHPVKAVMPWTTPATAGHYCLLVEPIWPDDADRRWTG
jgi:hypothetical protein